MLAGRESEHTFSLFALSHHGSHAHLPHLTRRSPSRSINKDRGVSLLYPPSAPTVSALNRACVVVWNVQSHVPRIGLTPSLPGVIYE